MLKASNRTASSAVLLMLLLKCVKTPTAIAVAALGILPRDRENVKVVRKECPEQGWRENSPKGQGVLAELLGSHKELFVLCWGESGSQHFRLCLQNPPSSECATVPEAKTHTASSFLALTVAQPTGIPESSSPVEPPRSEEAVI